MKKSDAGFTVVETLLALLVLALMSGAAATFIVLVIKGTAQTSEHMAVVYEVDKVSYWVSRDTQMASTLITEGLTPPEILILQWTDWGYDTDSVYHVVTYSIEDLSDGIGKLKRTHQDSMGTDEQTLIADYIYYNPDDPGNTTQVSYQSPLLNLKVVTLLQKTRETEEYQIYCRPNFNVVVE